jgi:hypothetical protein
VGGGACPSTLILVCRILAQCLPLGFPQSGSGRTSTAHTRSVQPTQPAVGHAHVALSLGLFLSLVNGPCKTVQVFIDDAQMRWFEETVEADSEKNIVVFSHAPPMGCGLKGEWVVIEVPYYLQSQVCARPDFCSDIANFTSNWRM